MKAEVFTPKLTRKQAEFVNQLIQNPKKNATEAAEKVYDTKNRNVARSIATENMSKPAIISALDQHVALAENTIIGTMKAWRDSQNSRRREIAMDAAKYTHDKIFGKATQRVEQQSVSVTIDVDLS